MCPDEYSSVSSLDSIKRTAGSFRCSSTQSVETSTSGWAYPRDSILSLICTCSIVSSQLPASSKTGGNYRSVRLTPFGAGNRHYDANTASNEDGLGTRGSTTAGRCQGQYGPARVDRIPGRQGRRPSREAVSAWGWGPTR